MRAVNVLGGQLVAELRARVAALDAENATLRAQLAALTPPTVVVGALTVDLRAGVIRQGDERCGKLTPTETRMLVILARTPGQPVAYDDMIRELWPDSPKPAALHAFRVNLCRMRAKIDPLSQHVRTEVWSGVGLYP